ncbi:hypothetical protein BpHYR1_051997 [Brachionus plicatilis]|uniref:Uncharacterized protein n=1 Tax=Brachionus plicatilis TaxID=10195 RepID=A0A3M7P470_BRAPC|nr:hypothetical protein BpHYR1_051997 [Brachionus plicatilis]
MDSDEYQEINSISKKNIVERLVRVESNFLFKIIQKLTKLKSNSRFNLKWTLVPAIKIHKILSFVCVDVVNQLKLAS